MPLAELPRIERLDLATLELPAHHPAADLGRSVAVHGFLIDHPDGTILVDTGVGFGNAFIDKVYRPTRAELTEVLARVGIELEDVVAVVNSHLHFDHCGQNPALFDSDTTFYAQAAEVMAVEADRFYTDATWALAPPGQRRTVHGDEQVAEGVTILATPGHTAGHQSVLVEGAGRRVVIGAQVVWLAEEIASEVASRANVDPVPELQAAAVESIRRLKALEPELVHLSHCAAYVPLA
ncbi:MAG: N-acyl homoserine lactonase family protein [Acidimicrobiales bacterium]